MLKINPKLRFNFLAIFLLVALLILILITAYFISLKNIQKGGLLANQSIKPQEVDHYLDLFNHERFTDDAKKITRDKIKREFEKFGYQVTEQDTGKYINILADKGKISTGYILVGAHYDTVPGAVGTDDNASGVSAMLLIAKYSHAPNIRFVAFDGEEDGLHGSRYYVDTAPIKPSLAIILETLGYSSNTPNTQAVPPFYNIMYRDLFNRLKANGFKGNFSASICTNNAKAICDEYESYASSINLEVYTVMVPGFPLIRNLFLDLFRSDHTPFLLEGIPSIMVTDTANFRNSNYHQPSDSRTTVNSGFIAKQASAILAVISN